MPDEDSELSVFLNCPFDKDFEPILQAMLFCLVYLGFEPHLATERIDSGESRLGKICELIEKSRYSIHDLSRCQSSEQGEHYRLNMPFELGIDYACRRYSGDGRDRKRILVLEEQQYRYQIALSDISGFDIKAHAGDYGTAIRQVRNWLVSEAGITADGAERIKRRWEDFQEWHYEKQLAAGFSEEDIQDYSTTELLNSMKHWMDLGRPL